MFAGCFGCIGLGSNGFASEGKCSQEESRRLAMKKNWVGGALEITDLLYR